MEDETGAIKEVTRRLSGSEPGIGRPLSATAGLDGHPAGPAQHPLCACVVRREQWRENPATMSDFVTSTTHAPPLLLS
jgi:ABC-type nitrate/sulfonate/bicarbonate transport system substrate-binding protein